MKKRKMLRQTIKLRARKCTGRQGDDKRCFKHIRTHENSSREKWKRKIKSVTKNKSSNCVTGWPNDTSTASPESGLAAE